MFPRLVPQEEGGGGGAVLTFLTQNLDFCWHLCFMNSLNLLLNGFFFPRWDLAVGAAELLVWWVCCSHMAVGVGCQPACWRSEAWRRSPGQPWLAFPPKWKYWPRWTAWFPWRSSPWGFCTVSSSSPQVCPPVALMKTPLALGEASCCRPAETSCSALRGCPVVLQNLACCLPAASQRACWTCCASPWDTATAAARPCSPASTPNSSPCGTPCWQEFTAGQTLSAFVFRLAVVISSLQFG